MTLVIIIGIAVVLFCLGFVTRRRFGVLGLGLAAGVMLSQLWSPGLMAFLKSQDLSIEPLSHGTLAAVSLILLPPLLLLMGGPTYHEKKMTLLGAMGFALLASLLILGPLARDLPLMDNSVRPVLTFIAQWHNALVATGVALAVLDMLAAHGPRLPGKKHAKH